MGAHSSSWLLHLGEGTQGESRDRPSLAPAPGVSAPILGVR